MTAVPLRVTLDPAFREAENAIEVLHEALHHDRSECSPSEAIAQLESIYHSTSDEVRYQIITQVIDLEYIGARRLLVHTLRNDANALLRHEAAFGLGVLGTPEHVEVLCEVLLKDPNPMVRHEAAIAIAEIGDLSALEPLQLAAEDKCPEVAASARYAIQKILLKHTIDTE